MTYNGSPFWVELLSRSFPFHGDSLSLSVKDLHSYPREPMSTQTFDIIPKTNGCQTKKGGKEKGKEGGRGQREKENEVRVFSVVRLFIQIQDGKW